MTADEAFDNLLNKNALPIPAGKSGRGTAGPSPSGGTELREYSPETMRVSELLDDPGPEYRPRSATDAGMHNYPTETDLDSVDPYAVDDIDAASDHGARILGRDADGDEPEDDEFVDSREVDGNGYDDPEPSDFPEPGHSPAALGDARRVKRFAYFPLSGMDGFESAVRDLASHLSALNPDKPSLAITSPVRREGRTELAIRVALALAKRVEYRVLLADFDLLNPQVAARLGISTKFFTLADVLRGACPLAEALVASEEDNLYVLPSRATDRDGDDVLDSRQSENVLREIHASFDFAVLDCGPVGHADAAILCRLAGAAALAGRGCFTTAGSLHRAAEKLEAAGARVAGMMLTEV